MILKDRKVFVTGGSGFIGGRLIESLTKDHEAAVFALVNRAHAGALRMARFNVNFVYKNLLDKEAMLEATKGCDTIFHLAYGRHGNATEQKRITIDATESLIEAALKNNVRRFVYVSTAAVYKRWIDGPMDETAERGVWGWDYADWKFLAEELVLKAHRERGLPATILQVAGVYGPWGEVFTLTPIQQIRTGRLVLPNNGEGLANATYVDDVIQALILSATKDEAVGEIFIIRGAEQSTRWQYFQFYERMLQREALISMDSREIIKKERNDKIKNTLLIPKHVIQSLKSDVNFRKVVSASYLKEIAKYFYNREKNKAVFREDSIHHSENDRTLYLPPKFMLNRLMAKTDLQIGKSERLLGYNPKYDLKAGMKKTEDWARWARLLD